MLILQERMLNKFRQCPENKQVFTYSKYCNGFLLVTVKCIEWIINNSSEANTDPHTRQASLGPPF